MKNNIDRNKCQAWIDLFFVIFKLTKSLTINEKKHITNCFLIGIGLSELFEEKEEKNNV